MTRGQRTEAGQVTRGLINHVRSLGVYPGVGEGGATGQISTKDNPGARLRGSCVETVPRCPIRPVWSHHPSSHGPWRGGRASQWLEGPQLQAAPFLHAERRSQPWEADGHAGSPASLDEVKVLMSVLILAGHGCED